jgi:DNA-binding transcriptional LysR family regulator
MDIRHLLYFVEVAKHRSFSKAAENLHVSQPTVSKMVKNLEDEVGAPLLERSAKSFQLTDVGEVVFNQGQQILHSFQSISAEIDDVKNIKKGNIRIGIPPMIGSRFFPHILSQFHKKYPLINIQIFEDGAKDLEQGVMDGKLDLAAVVLPIDHSIFNSFPFVKEDLRLVVHPQHRFAERQSVNLSELRDEPFILFREGFTLHYRIREECIKVGFEPNVVCESSQWDFISEMAAANLGVALLPETICRGLDPQRVRNVPLINPSIHWNLAIIWLKDKYLSYASREWLQFIQQLLHQLPIDES